jgi:hypothetical protein
MSKVLEWLRERAKAITQPRNWPGLLLLLYALIPDTSSRVAFWIDAGKRASGEVALVASILESGLFRTILALLAVAYLWFSQRKSQHPSPIKQRVTARIAWLVVAIVSAALFIVLGAGYTVSALGPRYLTDAQRNILRRELAKSSSTEHTVVLAETGGCADCSEYAIHIADAIAGVRNWKVQQMFVEGIGVRNVSKAGLEIDSVSRGPDLDSTTLLLVDAFSKAGIDWETSHSLTIYPKNVAEIHVMTKLRNPLPGNSAAPDGGPIIINPR